MYKKQEMAKKALSKRGKKTKITEVFKG